MENIAKTPTIARNYGLVAGLVITVVTLLQYLGGVEMYLSPVGYISYLVVITMAVLAALKVRASNGGFLDFSEALKTTFMVFAIALILQTLFVYILLNFIDIPFKQALAVETLNKSEIALKKFNFSDSEIDKIIDSEREKDQFTIGRMLLGYGISCILSFIFCLLISLIVKKSKPAFNNI